jgi:hypothetical protein
MVEFGGLRGWPQTKKETRQGVIQDFPGGDSYYGLFIRGEGLLGLLREAGVDGIGVTGVIVFRGELRPSKTDGNPSRPDVVAVPPSLTVQASSPHRPRKGKMARFRRFALPGSLRPTGVLKAGPAGPIRISGVQRRGLIVAVGFRVLLFIEVRS